MLQVDWILAKMLLTCQPTMVKEKGKFDYYFFWKKTNILFNSSNHQFILISKNLSKNNINSVGAEGNANDPFAMLRQHPQFTALRMMVQQNPQMLQPVLQQLGQQNPEILRIIQQNQQAFIQMLNEPVTPEQMAQIQAQVFFILMRFILMRFILMRNRNENKIKTKLFNQSIKRRFSLKK